MNKNQKDNGVSIVIPTLNGGTVFQQCISALRRQTYSGAVQLIVIDSGSTDGTVEFAQSMGAQIIQISPQDFHHAQTRNRAVRLATHEYCVMFVQDAIPSSPKLLDGLVKSLEDAGCSAAYGPQLPHGDAECYARFEVLNHAQYLGNEVVIQQLPPGAKAGELPYAEALRLARLDNVCSIYRTEELQQNPFPPVAFGEDMAWAWGALNRGGQVLYNPQLTVFHSHNRNPEYRFRRAIVDSLNCALILNRVHENTADLTADELKGLQTVMEEIKRVFHQAGVNGPRPDKSALSEPQSSLQELYQHAFMHHLTHILDSIQQYPDFNATAYDATVDQAAASMLGSLWGAVYARQVLANTLSEDMEQLVKPYCEGV